VICPVLNDSTYFFYLFASPIPFIPRVFWLSNSNSASVLYAQHWLEIYRIQSTFLSTISNLSLYQKSCSNKRSDPGNTQNSYARILSSQPLGLSSDFQQLSSSNSYYTPKGVGGGSHNGPSNNNNRSKELSTIVVAQLAVLVTTIGEDNWDSTVAQIREVCQMFQLQCFIFFSLFVFSLTFNFSALRTKRFWSLHQIFQKTRFYLLQSNFPDWTQACKS
jgi:hypothetical protein